MVRKSMPSMPPTKTGWVLLLALLTTCGSEEQPPTSRQLALTPRIFKPAPAGEVATWQRATSATAPEGRFLQAMTYDENRTLLLMFGGQTRGLMSTAVQSLQDMWEWSPSTGAWTLRPPVGNVPAARGGAAMVFDPRRTKMLLFGGRAASGYNYEDLWEWNPTTGAWTERSGTGKHPAARAQHAMLFQQSTGKILLFGGGRSNLNSDGTGVSASFGDTWELDPLTGTWTELAPASSPSMRHDFGLVWDSTRNKAVLFGGMQIDIPGATGVPKQDTWEWDPSTQTWSERTTAGSKPVQRAAHAMAYDANRNKVVVFGGSDMLTAGIRNDMWDWDPAAGSWTQTLTGTETGIPGTRSYSSMVYDGTRARIELVAGLVMYTDTSIGYKGVLPSNDVWELDSATLGFSNRSVTYQGPTARAYHAMAYNPSTGKVYVFGGVDMMKKGNDLTDLWEWDGSKWTEVVTEEKPSARIDAAMAYDPARQSLILFGGTSWSGGKTSNDTWELSESTRKWTRLPAIGSPSERWGHGMVTDTLRKKILVFGGAGSNSSIATEIWEWDGATTTWSNRTPAPSAKTPAGRTYPVMSFDETRGKLMLYDGSRNPSVDGESTSAYWEWDGLSGGWALHDPGDSLPSASNAYAAYDPIRRRHVFFTDGTVNGIQQTWELDANTETWITRSLEVTPGARFRSGMVFDSKRRVAVVFGGNLNTSPGGPANDTWEYTVKNLANGEGCNAATASTCASGQCVDGVCCETAGCTGPCMACNVRGSEGQCVLAQAGTEVPGSCSKGQACDGTGACKSKNGQACTSLADCASGFCVDNICCDSACGPTCKVCNLPGRLGICTPSPAGSDPKGECVQGTGVCKSTCDGAGACANPLGLSCGTCLVCDGLGTCTRSDPACGGSGGTGGKDSSNTKPIPGSGGIGGSVKSSGGAGGKSTPGSGGTGGSFSSSPVSSGGNVGGSSILSSSGGRGGSVSSSPVNSGGNVGGASGGIPSGPGGSVSYGGEVGGESSTIPSSVGGHGGIANSNTSGLPRDAGAGSDGGPSTRDAGAPDAALVGRLSSRGCSCALGQGTSKRTAPMGIWLLGAGLLALRSRRRQ